MRIINKYKQFIAGVLAFVGLAFFVSQASARVIVKERIKYYSVSGKTGAQLDRSIKRKGPKIGRRHAVAIATTAATFQIKNVKIGTRGRKCVVRRADVILKMTYTYPRWRGSRKASTKLKKNWKRFLAEVRKHEKKHGQINRKFAKQIERDIRRSTGSVKRRCSDLGKSYVRKLKRNQRNHNRQHERFDRRESRYWARIRKLQAAVKASR